MPAADANVVQLAALARGVVPIATAAGPAMSLRRGAPAARIVVARIESIEHDTPHSGPALAPIRWRV